MSRLSRFLFGGKYADKHYAEYVSIKEVQPQDVFIAGYPKSGNTWFRLFLTRLLQPEASLDINAEKQRSAA